MRKNTSKRAVVPKVVLSFRVSAETRKLADLLAAHYTIKTGDKHTMSEMVNIALQFLAKKEGVTCEGGGDGQK